VAPSRSISFDFGATLLDLKSRSLTVEPFLTAYLAAPEVPFNLVPKTTVTAGVNWTFPLPETFGSVTLSADYYHSSKVKSSDAVLPAYDLVNARIDIAEIAESPLDVAFFMRNVFNETYLASSNVGSNALGINSGFYGAPRTYGIELRFRFGN
jgi:iron complex outermembrane recepter protein